MRTTIFIFIVCFSVKLLAQEKYKDNNCELINTIVNTIKGEKEKIYIINKYSGSLDEYLLKIQKSDENGYKRSKDTLEKYFKTKKIISTKRKLRMLNCKIEGGYYVNKNEIFDIFEKHGVSGWDAYYDKFGPYSFVYFSEPVYNKDRTLALIQMEYASGGLSGASKYVIYKYTDNKWSRVSILLGGWVS